MSVADESKRDVGYAGLASYGEADTFDRTAARGFMYLHGLPTTGWAQKLGAKQESCSFLFIFLALMP